MRRLAGAGLASAVWLLWLALAVAPPPAAATDRAIVGTWTVRIPEAFPRYLYTWRIAANGTYEEDGREAATGRPIQRTLRGSWAVEGERLVLRQSGLGFVFDGTLSGERYAGTLTLDGRPVSPFCAARGEQAPRRCESAPLISAVPPPRG